MIVLRNKNYSGKGDLLKAGALLTIPLAMTGGAYLATRNRGNRGNQYTPAPSKTVNSYNPDNEEDYYRNVVGDTGKLLQTNNPQLYNKIKTLPDNYITGNSGARYPFHTYRRLGREGYNTYDNNRPVDFHIIGENEKGALVVNPNIKNGELYNYDAETGRLKKTTLEKWRK